MEGGHWRASDEEPPDPDRRDAMSRCRLPPVLVFSLSDINGRQAIAPSCWSRAVAR
jgi:hypothetical protein